MINARDLNDMYWVDFFYVETDTLDIDRLAPLIADDIEVRFGNTPPIHGKAAALETFKAFWSGIAGMTHHREELVEQGDTVVMIATVTYTRLDRTEVPLPVASYLRRNAEGKVDRLWVYIDLAPLFAPAV